MSKDGLLVCLLASGGANKASEQINSSLVQALVGGLLLFLYRREVIRSDQRCIRACSGSSPSNGVFAELKLVEHACAVR